MMGDGQNSIFSVIRDSCMNFQKSIKSFILVNFLQKCNVLNPKMGEMVKRL